MAVRRPLPFEEIFYVPAPTGGWNPDANTWELAPNQAPVLDNALVRPGRVVIRGSLTNWADLSTLTTPVPPLNVAGVQPVPGTAKLAIGRKAISATAFVDPWFAPIVRPVAGSALAAPTADMAIAFGATTFTNTAIAANLIPGPRGISFEGTRYYIGYGTLTAPVADAGGTFFAQSTNLCTISSAGAVAAMTNAPRGFIDIKGYQSRIWGLGGIDDPGSGTTFNALALFFTNPIGPGGGNAASFGDWKDPVFLTTNKIVMDGDTTDPGVGLAVVRNGLLIFRKQSVWLLRGTTSASYSLTPVSRQVGCVDPRSIVETDKGVYFMSTQGLMITDGVSVRNVSGTVLYTLQNAVTVVTAAIMSSFGGYVTSTIASSGQLIISMGIASVTSGAPDGHIQPVWSGMFDPNTNAWTRVTSSLFAADAVIITPGNNYPGQVFNTPDQRVLSIGDKFITQWEAGSSTNVVSALTASGSPGAVTNDASVGTVPWTSPTNAAVADGVNTTATLTFAAASGGLKPATAISQSGSGPAWINLANGVGATFGTPNPAITFPTAPATGETLVWSNFGFAIPAGATINNIIVLVQGTMDTGGSGDIGYTLQLSKAGTPTGGVTASAVLNSTNAPIFQVGVHTGGGSTFTPLSTTWTAADINNAAFGVALTPHSNNPSSGHLLSFGINVGYTLADEILEATAYGFAIPSGATITGIQVSTTRSSASGHVQDLSVQLYKAGALQATNRSLGPSLTQAGFQDVPSAVWGTSPATNTYGGSADLWGTTWTPTDINNAGFGVGITAINAATNNTSDTAQLDWVGVTVYYTLASITHQQSFVKVPALYDTDPAGNFQPIPFRWLGQLFPLIGTSTGRRKVGQLKRLIFDYVFQGIGLPSANGFTVRPVDSSNNLVQGAASIQLAPTNNSMSNSSISGGQPNASTAIERQSADLNSEATDMSFDITWTDAQQSSQPSYVAAEIYGVGIQWLPGRDLR